MKKSLIFSAILLSMSASAFASSNAVDNVVGGDANGKDGYKTGVHINNAGSGTGLADELVIDRTASGVTISTDPYNGQNSDLHKVVDLTSKEYVDQKNSDQDRNINALAGENATQNKQIVELQNSKADVTYVDQKIANIKQGDQIVNNDNSGRGSVDNSVGTVGNGGKVTINNTMTGPITGSVNNSACGSVAAGGHCEVTNTTVNQKVDFDKLTEEQKKQIRGEQGAAGKDGLAKVDGDTGVVGTHDGKEFDLSSQKELDAEASKRADADAALNSYKSATNGRLDGIDRTNARQDRQLADHEGRIGKLEQGVATLQEDVDHLKSGLAGTVAIATLVEPRYKGDTSLAVGVGVYQDAQALAVGLTHHFDNGVSGKIAVAADPAAFSDTVVAGASVGYSW